MDDLRNQYHQLMHLVACAAIQCGEAIDDDSDVTHRLTITSDTITRLVPDGNFKVYSDPDTNGLIVEIVKSPRAKHLETLATNVDEDSVGVIMGGEGSA